MKSMLCARISPGVLMLSAIAPIAIAQTAVRSNSFDLASVKTGDPSFRGMSLVRTALTGYYDYTLNWTPDTAEAREPHASEQATGPSLFTAVQEQPGLKLKPAKGPAEVLVIDHAEKSSAN